MKRLIILVMFFSAIQGLFALLSGSGQKDGLFI